MIEFFLGLSCENCAPGFTRQESGAWLGRCVSSIRTCGIFSGILLFIAIYFRYRMKHLVDKDIMVIHHVKYHAK